MMKAVIYNKKASPDRFIYQDVDKPVPKDNEVLIKIAAVSVNAADYRSLKMGMIPRKKIFGSGIAGKVESVGKAIRQFKSGDAVLGQLSDIGFGGLAEYAVAPENVLAHKPEAVSYEVAATLPVAATTALQALRDKGNIQPGQKVLILGSSGGVGTFAVQLARHFGAEVTAVCSTRNLEQSTALGADFVVDYTQEDITKSNKLFDLIIAINGNYALLACKRILSQNGMYVMVGGTLLQIFKAMLLGPFLSWGSKKIRTLAEKPNQEDLGFVAKLVAEGNIRPVMERRYPLDQTAAAMQYLAEGHAKGKVVIHVDDF